MASTNRDSTLLSSGRLVTTTIMEFQKRKDEVILGLNEQGPNAALFWEVSYYY